MRALFNRYYDLGKKVLDRDSRAVLEEIRGCGGWSGRHSLRSLHPCEETSEDCNSPIIQGTNYDSFRLISLYQKIVDGVAKANIVRLKPE